MSRKSIGERIAELMVRTAYRDLRDGIGGAPQLSIPAIAAQLGVIQHQLGELVVQCLETYYGSSLAHERELRRAWEAHCRRSDPAMDRETVRLSRMGGALAVRQLAGVGYSSAELAEYAWLFCMRRETLGAAALLAKEWLDDHRHAGLQALREGLLPQAA